MGSNTSAQFLLGASLVVAGSCVVSITAMASLPSGTEIARRAEQASRGFGGQRVDASLITTDESGEKRTAKLVQLWLEQPDGGLLSLIRFTEPKELAGSGLLTKELSDGTHQRWLYLSGTKSLKQISAETQSATFIGSEFTYEDLSFAPVDRYSYETIGEETTEGRATYKVKRTPRFEGSAYGHALVYFDKEHHYPVRTEFYARSGELLKVAIARGHTQKDGRWRPAEVEMKSSRVRRASLFKAESYKVGLKLSEKLFSVDQLNR